MVSASLGASIGLISGLFGVGGGLLFVPAQVNLLKIPMKRAVGNSLTGVLLTGLSGVIAHGMLGHVDWALGAILLAGGLLGVRAGTHRLTLTSKDVLRKALALLLLIAAVEMFWRGASAFDWKTLNGW